MGGSNVHANDAMIRRLETEFREKENFANAIIERAQKDVRDLTDDDRSLIKEARGRMSEIKGQIDDLEDVARVAFETQNRMTEVDQAFSDHRRRATVGEVEYRSAGAWMLDIYQAHLGDRGANERLAVFNRTAAHQKTSDNLGIVPDPIVGDVINFIDTNRPIVAALGTQPLVYGTWHRPLVTQHTSVGAQGSAGAAADEKSELVSQKMTITRKTGNAKTYGGYVNISRQDIDFSQPSILDNVVMDLSGQYAIDTEAAVGTALAAASDATPVSYDAASQTSVATAVWSAASAAYTATRGKGRLLLAVAPDVLATFGPLFAPYGPFNQQGTGFSAGQFGQGPVGTISGVPVLMSAGLGSGEAFLFSSAALELYEQKVGALQVVEPSVAGLQVAYIGYFTALEIIDAGIIPLEASGS
ncbi:phage major capsid protein [Mycobacterium marinum]|uniref:phage major capsid protein n=1 Tax=Mycobacterium marinum TaxID=1781 RepID=UPI000B974BD2|nr:phage major capsid protein [Mycobacterium marinum]